MHSGRVWSCLCCLAFRLRLRRHGIVHWSRIDSRNNCVFNMASPNVRRLCGAQVLCDLQHLTLVQQISHIASREMGGGHFGASHVFVMRCKCWNPTWRSALESPPMLRKILSGASQMGLSTWGPVPGTTVACLATSAQSRQLFLDTPWEGPNLKRGEGTVDWDTVASNCSTGNCLSNFNKRISSKSSNLYI